MNDAAFYGTCAQVIPLLWIVIVFEWRLYWPARGRGILSMEADEEHHQWPWPIAGFLAITGVVMLIAEWRAITTLATEEAASSGDETLVKFAVGLGLFWVFLLPTWPWVETTLDRTPLGAVKFWVWDKLGVGQASARPPREAEKQAKRAKRHSK